MGGVGVRLFLFLLTLAKVVTLILAALVTDITFPDNIQDSARWNVSEFGACSVVCGGGIQVRNVRCVGSSQTFGKNRERKVPESWCPQPVPHQTRPCNGHLCSARWTSGKWSECSITCGVGTQSRQVSCQTTPWTGQGHSGEDLECEGAAPESTRRCHSADCPFDKVEPHSILSENYTLIQLYRTKKIKLNIGGQVNLLPGQSVVVRCPVKLYPKELIYWIKGYRLVPFIGRVRITAGGLHITRADPSTDSGIYTCKAGDLTATVTVTFIEKNDPSTIMYKKWIKKSNKRHKKYPVKYKNSLVDNNIIWITPTSEDLNQQMDQSHNLSQSLIFVTSDWSTCQPGTCGARGHRKRKVTCSHVTPKYVKIVSDVECQQAGLDKPETTQECPMDKCAVWQTGPWSKCLPECAMTGHSNRILTCVWETTNEPAGAACDSRNKPAVSKMCKPRTCASKCCDRSRYCSLSRLLKLCRFHYFQQKCCHTCQSLLNSRS